MSGPPSPENHSSDARREPAPERKAYRRPELVAYGSVAQVIRGQASNRAGDFNGGATKMCWIAEALYGVDAPRTTLVRAWLVDRYRHRAAWASVCVPLYARWGRQVARGVRSNALVRRACARVFDGCVRRAHAYYAGAARTSISPSA